MIVMCFKSSFGERKGLSLFRSGLLLLHQRCARYLLSFVAFCWRKTQWKKMLPTFFLLCCRCVVVMLNGPFPSDSSTAHADPECLDKSDKVCAQLLSFPSTKHFFFQPCLKNTGKLGTSIRFSGFFGISCLIPVVHHGFPQVRVKCTCDGGGALGSCGDTTVDGENPASVEFGSLF